MPSSVEQIAQGQKQGSGKGKKRSLFTLFASSILALEAILIFCATLAAWGLMQGFFNQEGQRYSILAADKSLRPLVLILGFILALLLFSAIAMLRHHWGVLYGWGLQILVVAFGVILTPMFVLGICFTGMWWYAVRTGHRLDRENAERELLLISDA